MKNQAGMTALLLSLGLVIAAGEPEARYLRSQPQSDEIVVLDQVTGLMWKGCNGNKTAVDCSGGVFHSSVWQGAVSHCQESTWGGYDDWRLPNIRELLSITEDRWHDPAIDQVAFPGTPSRKVWSSTSCDADYDLAWVVDFLSGNSQRVSKVSGGYMRCVRLGL